MPTSVLAVPMHNATAADFRTWGKAVSDAFAAVGLVKVPDTGTIDWATTPGPGATTPGGTGIVAGFEIWRFQDALQPTHPVFIKVEYGSIHHATFPGMWVTIGRGTDGAGNIAGVLAPRRAAEGSTGTSGVAPTSIEPIYVSSDGSSLAFSARIGAGSTAVRMPAFVIERSRDHAGVATATGGVVLTEGAGMITAALTSSSSTYCAQMHAWTYAGDSTMGDVPAVLPDQVNGAPVSASTSLAAGDKAPVFPFVVVVPNHAPWQVLAAVAVVASDAANGPFTANVLGRVRTYRSIPVGEAHNRWMTGKSSLGYSGLCILWEQ